MAIGIPAVAESQHARVRRHYDVDDDIAVAPATERSSLRGVLDESQCAQPVRERGEQRVRGDIHDGVDVPGRPNAAGAGIADEDAGRASADEDEFIEYAPRD
jgi:hypothetical protein